MVNRKNRLIFSRNAYVTDKSVYFTTISECRPYLYYYITFGFVVKTIVSMTTPRRKHYNSGHVCDYVGTVLTFVIRPMSELF